MSHDITLILTFPLFYLFDHWVQDDTFTILRYNINVHFHKAFLRYGVPRLIGSLHVWESICAKPKTRAPQRWTLSNSSLPVLTKHIEQACLNSCVSAKGFFAKSTAAGRSFTSGIPTAIPIGASLLFSWNRARSQINYTSSTQSKLAMTKETINNTNLWSERTRSIIYNL